MEEVSNNSTFHIDSHMTLLVFSYQKTWKPHLHKSVEVGVTHRHVMHHPVFFISTHLTFFLLVLVPLSRGIDEITLGAPISDDQDETLLSAGRRFELGFFSLGTSANSKRYVGIWYYGNPSTVVWVANRESPLSDRSGAFSLDVNGNLGLSSSNGSSHWSTNLKAGLSSNRTVELMDSGDLVLSETTEDGGQEILWHSFDDPTDTFLPGMEMGGEDFKLTSWKGPDDPAPGDFTFQQDQELNNQYIIQRMESSVYWQSGVSWKLIPDGVPSAISSLLGSSSSDIGQSKNVTSNARLMMNFDGKIQYFTSSSGTRPWNLSWFEPRDPCDVFNACGDFGICNSRKIPMCRCLDGFTPQEPESWNRSDFSQGCTRTTPLCGKTNLTSFQSLKLEKVGRTNLGGESTDPMQCEEECRADCNCQAYSYTNNQSAPTGKCWIWSQYLNNIKEGNGTSRDVYVRVAPSAAISPSATNLGSSPKRKPRYITYLVAVVALVLVIAVASLLFLWRKFVRKRAKKDSRRRITELINSGQFTEERINVPCFDMGVILEATNYLADENKLGQGGFGPVYKGKFPGGQEIAVKRLSSGSGQGLEQFKNEVLLIAQLQHRNLVRLLGYCTQDEEKLLIYEYMPNKSLDSFIFDRTRCVLLTWEIRMEIILGIARGMFYLHHDSRLRIIHRDLKASNVLLDDDMTPKISDFGLARIFDAKQTEANTKRVVGTYGYMSPEYALGGFFSIKSDVFSFGVVVLEIISGKRNTGFYESEVALNLLSYAWRLWNEGNSINLIDPALHGTCNRDEAVKYIKLALLCVQNDPSERPTMSNIVSTLSNENVTLPTPKQPAFVVERHYSCNASPSSRPESYYEISNSVEQGR